MPRGESGLRDCPRLAAPPPRASWRFSPICERAFSSRSVRRVHLEMRKRSYLMRSDPPPAAIWRRSRRPRTFSRRSRPATTMIGCAGGRGGRRGRGRDRTRGAQKWRSFGPSSAFFRTLGLRCGTTAASRKPAGTGRASGGSGAFNSRPVPHKDGRDVGGDVGDRGSVQRREAWKAGLAVRDDACSVGDSSGGDHQRSLPPVGSTAEGAWHVSFCS